MRNLLSFALLGLVPPLKALAAPAEHRATIPLPQRLLHQFPNGTWVENIHVRPNGNLLITTSTPNASVYQVHEPWTTTPSVTLVHTFNEYVDRLIGIGESTTEKYVVVGSRFDSTALSGLPINGTWAAMELDFTKNHNTPIPRLIARMPEAYLLQSVDSLSNDKAVVLISDQFLRSQGKVWRLDTRTGKYRIVIDGLEEMNTSLKVGDVGINGLKVRGNQLYWVNSDQGNIYRLQIDATGAAAPGAKPVLVAHYPGSTFDDFTFGPYDRDEIWTTGNSDNRLLAVGLNGETVVVLGNGTNTILPLPTACQFGTQHDKTILYVTGRDWELPVNGTYMIGGWVRAVDTTGFRL
ncbi:hypothetical protein AAE478_003205 [Parahypoxylon ruwenzoriense]